MTNRTGVLIVGAGPSGMMIGNVLARAGVEFRIIEKTEKPTTESRANITHTRTLELLDKLGLADKAIEMAVIVRGLDLFQRGKYRAHLDFDGPEAVPTRFPHSLGFRQGEMQSLLYDDMKAHGGHVEWQKSFLSLQANTNGVIATITDATGAEEVIRADYVVAADGGRSTVRDAAGIELEGSTYEQTAFLADVKLEKPYRAECNTLNQTDGGFVGILPYKQDRQYRLFGVLSKDYAERFQAMEQGREVSLEELNRWFKDMFFLDNRVLESKWTTIFRIHRRIAPTFQAGRIFLVGDAGHIHAPAGGQGMNLGVGDAFNIAWKLADVLKGNARSELLDTYSAERHPIAKKIINGADKGFELEATQGWAVEIFRMYVLPVIVSIGIRTRPMRRMMVNLFSQTWITYRDANTNIATKSGGKFKAGDRLPFFRCQAQGMPVSDTHAITAGTEHVLIQLVQRPTNAPAAVSFWEGAKFAKVVVVAESAANDEFRAAFPNATSIHVRPDGHIACIGGQGVSDDAFFQRYYPGSTNISLGA
jgi:2-polyprenyl-6-methoxyphenol hydroxylase-like FAD-dependent oxidoreductase